MAITHFTPAPWRAKAGCPWDIEGPRGEPVAQAQQQSAEMERTANTHLIASAPELYTVLDAFLSAYEEGDGVDYKLRRRAQAVLDKAVGG